MPRVETFNREQVLEDAMQTFWRHGYNATSMQQLVEATGLNRSSLYNSFGDKKEMYQSSLKWYMEQSQKKITAAISNAKDPIDALRSIFKVFLPEIVLESKSCMGMSCKAEMNADISIKAYLENHQEQSLIMFESIIKDGQETGQINKNRSSREYSWHIFNAFQGYRMTGILVKNRTVLENIIETNLDILK